MKNLLAAVLLVAAFSLPSLSVHATPLLANSLGSDSSYESAFDNFSPNLLTGSTITDNGVTPDYGSSYAGLTDGAATLGGGNAANNAYFGNGIAGTSLASDPEVTFTLNTTGPGGSSTGYTLTSIISIYGWQNFPSMSDQNYTVSYSTVANPGTFNPLASVTYAPFTDGSDGPYNASMVTLTSADLTGAVGVAALRFDFAPLPAGQSGQMIHELEVNGTPTEAPEPTTWALLGLGMLTLVGGLRFRKSVS